MVKYENKDLLQYMHEIENIKTITPEESEDLYLAYKNGCKNAKEQLINGLLIQVFHIAKTKANNDQELLDFISIGNLELVRCIEKLDITKNDKKPFSYVASSMINNSIQRYIDKTNKKNNQEKSIYHKEKYISKGKIVYRDFGENITYEYQFDPTSTEAEKSILEDYFINLINLSTYKAEVLKGKVYGKYFLTEIESEIFKSYYMTLKNKDIENTLEKKYGITKQSTTKRINECFKKIRKIQEFEDLCRDMNIKIKNENIKTNIKILEKRQ